MLRLRPARIGEEVQLTELALRSSQETWRYPDSFMEWEPDALEVFPSFITDAITTVLEVDGELVGFYTLRRFEDAMELSRMFVAPEHTGSGYGRQLWEHAVATVRAHGVALMTLDADPNAEAFYVKMGAVTVGELDLIPPMLPDWRIKMMHFRITDEDS